MNKLFTFSNARAFLDHAQAALEADEAANSLILGVCFRLLEIPEPEAGEICLKVIEDERGLALAAMMTPPHNLSLSGHTFDLDCTLALLVSELASERWALPGVLAPTLIARGFAEKWSERSQTGSQLNGRLDLFELRQAPPDTLASAVAGRLRPAGEQELALIASWCYQFSLEIFKSVDKWGEHRMAEQRIHAGDIFVWEDGGQPVSMAMKTRPTRRSIPVSYVYTPPELRGKGYATACVGELSRRLLHSGWEFCTLFVDVNNLPAYRIYRKIGYQLVKEFSEYVFKQS